MFRRTERGFTLIELLVVIAIIGLLSSVVLASLNGARKKGRDARRLADLKELQTALELYYNDNGTYPVVTAQTAVTSALSPLSGNYMTVISDDPLGGSYHYVYRSTTDGATPAHSHYYCIGSIMEVTTGIPQSSCRTGDVTLTGVNYSVGP